MINFVKALNCLIGFRCIYILFKVAYIIIGIMELFNYYFLSGLVSSILTKNIIDFHNYFVIMIVYGTFLKLLSFFVDLYYSRIIVRMNNRIKISVYQSFFSFYQFVDNKSISIYNNIFMEDYSSPMNYLDSYFDFIREFIILSYITIVIAFSDIKLLYTLFLSIPIILISLFFTKKIKRLKKIDYSFTDNILSLVEKTTASINHSILYSNLDSILIKSLKSSIKSKIRNTDRLNKSKLYFQYTIDIIMNLNVYVFYFISFNLIIFGKLDINFFVFITIYVQKILVSILSITKIIPQLEMNSVSLERLFLVLDRLKNNRSLQKKRKVNRIRSIHIKNGCFTINNIMILSSINLKITDKSKIIVHGRNGAGKSSIIRLLTSNYLLCDGELLYNDIDVKEYDMNSIVKRICVLYQKPVVFPLSFRENILYEEKNGYKIDELIEDFELRDCIMKFPNGIDTIIDDSLNLSAGEIKKINLIRCMTSEADFYFLDEPLANLDIDFRARFDFLLFKYLKDKAVFIVEHDNYDSTFFDKKYLVKEGVLFRER